MPDVDALSGTGETILAVAAFGLDRGGRGDDYTRLVVSHGDAVPVEPGKAGQLTVTCHRVFIGKAGQERFQFPMGEPGTQAEVTAVYAVELSHTWPSRGAQGAATPVDPLSEAREALWRDGWCVFSALRAAGLGGISPALAPTGNGVIVGPLTPRGPLGGFATWVMDVAVELV